MNKCTYSFHNFRTISTFSGDIFNSTITIKEADTDQNDLLVEILNFRKQGKPENKEKKQQKEDVLKNLHNLFKGRERVLNAFQSKIFPIKKLKAQTILDHSNLEILTPKKIFQRLPIALVQVKAGNTSENLLNEIK